MADSKAPGNLSVSPPSQIPKDVPGPDCSIPLSPQWLLPKQGESKLGLAPGENLSGSTNLADTGKMSESGDKAHDSQKKKDVFRPTFLESESTRRDRWRDEERDTNVSIRRDRWREGDKELGDTRKMERWADNPPLKGFGEIRRPPSDRWIDQSKEPAFDNRRESKWNTRWGPGDKEMDKWNDTGKHGNTSQDKGLSHVMNHGKDDKEVDHVRPWRPYSAMSRGKTESLHHQSQMTSKDGHSFGHGRGRGDNAPPAYTPGRGRGNFIMNSASKIPTHDLPVDKDGYGLGETTPYRYSRAKLLDLYRVTDMRLLPKLLDGFSEVPSLTQEGPVEPLAFSALTSEELTILKGIDQGDIVSSGAPQISKDGSAGRGSSDSVQTRRSRLGSRDDLSLPVDESYQSADAHKDNGSGFSVGSFPDKHMSISSRQELMEDHQKYADSMHNVEALRDGSFTRADDVPRNRELNMHSNVRTQSSVGRQPSTEEHAHYSAHGWFDVPGNVQARNNEIGWSEARKEQSSLAKPSYAHNEPKWLDGNAITNKQQSVLVDRELEARKHLQPAPEDLILYYKDPHGQVQGPFSGVDIIGWYEAGYFGLDLLVRLANAPLDSPFSLLGDVMPHLRSKARPPPGFSAPKPNEIPDINTRPVLTNVGKVLTGPSGIDMIRNEQRQVRGPANEAENRFLESLMNSGVSSSALDRFSASEGPQGYTGHNLGAFPFLGMEGGDPQSLLATRLSLERQRSLSNSFPNWPGKEASSMVPPSEFSPQPSHPQNVDMMSVLQGLQSNQNVPPQAFGQPQHRMQAQNHPAVANLLGQTLDSPPSLTPEKFLSSGGSQDPQMLNLLHQQYLLQMQSQTSLPAQQLSLLDKMLLLKQQQKQEEQLRQQQQQLLSQVLTEHHQRFGEPSYGHLHPAVAGAATVGASLPMTSAPLDHLRQIFPQQIPQDIPQAPVSSVQEDRISNYANMPPHVSQESGYTGASDSASALSHLPHLVSGIHHKNQVTLPAQDGEIEIKDSSVPASFAEDISKPQATGSFKVDSASSELLVSSSTKQLSQIHMDGNAPTSLAANEAEQFVASDLSLASQAKLSERTIDNEAATVPEHKNNVKELPSTDVDIKVEQSRKASADSGEAKRAEVHELRKASEKKSRKKSSKSQSSSEQVKGVAKSSLQHSKQTETEVASDSKPDVPVKSFSRVDNQEPSDAQKVTETLLQFGMEAMESKEEAKAVESAEKQNTQGSASQRGWKPAANVKPKSLLEIQQEEARKVQAEIAVSAVTSSVSALSLSAPWSGIVASSEPKVTREALQDGSKNEGVTKKSEDLKKKSQLHDLLAAEVLAKSSGRETPIVAVRPELPSLAPPSSQADSVDDDFIEAKDTKKSRKKAGKNKGAGSKPSAPVSSVDVIAPSTLEKSKSTRQMQQESRDVLPAPPMGPSLGDFVLWKGESTSPTPAPAWSTDNGKLPKPTSLRDILKEQGKKGVPNQQQPQLAAPQKPQSTQVARTSSRSLSGTSPSNAAAPIQISSRASPQTKYKAEDDLFWGPPEQSKHDAKKAEFPQLGNLGSFGTKSTPVKSTSGASLSAQKSANRKPVEISSSPASAQSLKGKRNGDTKRSEAMEFRDWCESESMRLTGSKDTSFVEFCLKQSRSEAEILLIQNLGGLDTNHEFIHKLLNYMDMLPSDVLNIAFQGRNDQKVTALSARDMTSDNVGTADYDNYNTGGIDGSSKGGKKKGKKGKKVSPSVLGFNVVSNRIMMGEIQTVED